MKPSTIKVELRSNCVTYQGRRWRVTQGLAEFLYTINDAWPHAVDDNTIIAKMWGGGNRDKTPKAVSLLAHKARMMLAPLGVNILRVDRGFRLEFPAEDEEQP